MNMETGELVENPTPEQIKDNGLLPLSEKEAAFLKPYKPEERLCALHWMHYLARKDVVFGSIVEKMKAKKAFFESWELAVEAKEEGLRVAD
jgi:hypothetical protein